MRSFWISPRQISTRPAWLLGSLSLLMLAAAGGPAAARAAGGGAGSAGGVVVRERLVVVPDGADHVPLHDLHVVNVVEQPETLRPDAPDELDLRADCARGRLAVPPESPDRRVWRL